MNSPTANLSVWVGKKMVCVKIVGRANFTSSVAFKTLINSLRERGYSRFVLELSECALMDSTFLGVLAGIGLNFSGARNGRHEPFVELLNPRQKISELLENLGNGRSGVRIDAQLLAFVFLRCDRFFLADQRDRKIRSRDREDLRPIKESPSQNRIHMS